MIGMPGMKFAITVSAYDCTGCGSCANVCPGKKGEKALLVENMEANVASQDIFAVSYTHLDVYKRQVHDYFSPFRIHHPLFPDSRIHIFIKFYN